jgi:alkylation response protein AidB-like acyl-CoA dehydrogenase
LHVTVVASFVAKAANRSFTDEEIRDALDQLCNLGLAELKVPDNYAPIRAHEFDQEVLDEVLQTVSAVGPANTQSLIDHQASIAFRISEQQMHTALGRLEKDGLIMQTEAGPELTEKGNQETARLWGQRES